MEMLPVFVLVGNYYCKRAVTRYSFIFTGFINSTVPVQYYTLACTYGFKSEKSK